MDVAEFLHRWSWRLELWRARFTRTWWKLRGAKVADDVRILGPVTMVGDYRNLEIGEGSRLNPGVVLNMRERLTIGRDVHVSSRAQLVTATIVPDVIPRVHEGAPVTIDDHAWIAAGVIVTPGVTVGARSVVAANSVVTEDVAPDTLVAGSPAKLVRTLDQGEPRPAVAGDGSG